MLYLINEYSMISSICNTRSNCFTQFASFFTKLHCNQNVFAIVIAPLKVVYSSITFGL